MFLEWAVHLSLHATTQTPLWPEADFLRPPPPVAMASYYDEPVPLTEQDLARVALAPELLLPTPAEIFAAYRRQNRPDWNKAYPMPSGREPGNRVTISAHLGIAFANAELAVEARDAQQLAIELERMQTLSRALGVGLAEMGRINNLRQFARDNLWNLLKSELEATVNEIRVELAGQRDERLMLVIELAQWVRALEIVSQFIDSEYDREATSVLLQARPAEIMAGRLESAFANRAEEKQIKGLVTLLRDIRGPMTPEEEAAGAGGVSDVLGQIQVNRISRELSRFLREATSR